VSDSPARRRRALQRGYETEDLIAKRLSDAGWTVLSRNWRGGGGELDLVVMREDSLRFVEVKARKADDALAWEAVTRAKRRRLMGAANAWLRAHDVYFDECAFLVAFVAWTGEVPQVSWVDDAFDEG
jgi:putative endonuclease